MKHNETRCLCCKHSLPRNRRPGCCPRNGPWSETDHVQTHEPWTEHPPNLIKHAFSPLWGSGHGCWPTRVCLGSGARLCTCRSCLKCKPTAHLAAANYRGESQTANPCTRSGLSGRVVGVPRCWLMAVNPGVGSCWGGLCCRSIPGAQASPL